MRARTNVDQSLVTAYDMRLYKHILESTNWHLIDNDASGHIKAEDQSIETSYQNSSLRKVGGGVGSGSGGQPSDNEEIILRSIASVIICITTENRGRCIEEELSHRPIWRLASATGRVHSSRPARKRFPRNPYIVNNVGNLWELNLADISPLASYKVGYKYLLNAINEFFKYAYSKYADSLQGS